MTHYGNSQQPEKGSDNPALNTPEIDTTQYHSDATNSIPDEAPRRNDAGIN